MSQIKDPQNTKEEMHMMKTTTMMAIATVGKELSARRNDILHSSIFYLFLLHSYFQSFSFLRGKIRVTSQFVYLFV